VASPRRDLERVELHGFHADEVRFGAEPPQQREELPGREAVGFGCSGPGGVGGVEDVDVE
jgi:hypothetical protein